MKKRLMYLHTSSENTMTGW